MALLEEYKISFTPIENGKIEFFILERVVESQWKVIYSGTAKTQTEAIMKGREYVRARKVEGKQSNS